MSLHSRSMPALVLFSVLMRVLPHPPNLTPLEALAVFTGFIWKREPFRAYSVPLLAIFLSDLILGFHPYMFWVYGSFGLSVLISYTFLKKVTLSSLGLTSVFSSLIFYAVTNFGVWVQGGLYPLNGNGFLVCYWAGLPFLMGSIFGGVFYSAIFFSYDSLQQSTARIFQRNILHM